MHAYNYKNYICWIKYHDTKIEYLLILVEFYAPLWICFVYFIINLCCTIKKNRLKINEKCLKKYYMIKLYPISLLLCWVWGSIDIISDLSGMNYKILKILNVFFGGIQGSLNAIFFLSTNEVRHILKTQLCSMLPCFYNRKSQYKHRLHEESNESKDETDNQDKKIHEQELVNC